MLCFFENSVNIFLNCQEIYSIYIYTSYNDDELFHVMGRSNSQRLIWLEVPWEIPNTKHIYRHALMEK